MTAKGLCIALLAVWGTGLAGAQIIRVDDDAPAGGDGSSWTTAFRCLQDAIAVAGTGTEIRVAGGRYFPDRDEVGEITPGDRSASFMLRAHVAVRGGYAGLADPEHPDVRNLSLYESILSGDLAEDDEPGFVNDAENSRHVVYGPGVSSTAVLDGVTITGGNADGEGDASEGGGMRLDGAQPTLVDCLFTANRCARNGGGLAAESSSPAMTRCRFVGNESGEDGGGAWLYYYSSPTITDCTFEDNRANDYTGGGLVCHNNCHPRIEGCTFRRNWTWGHGSAIYCYWSYPTIIECTIVGNSGASAISCWNHSDPTITRCVLAGNDNDAYGGALLCSNGQPTLSDCLITGNRSAGYGGGVYCSSSSDVNITSCRIVGNRSIDFQADGAGLASDRSSLTVHNSVLSGNVAEEYGGALWARSEATLTLSLCTLADNSAAAGRTLGCDSYEQSEPSTIHFTSCIIWNGGDEAWNNDASTINVNYSAVTGGWSGTGNTGDDPLLVDGGSGTWTAVAFDEATCQITFTDAGAAWTPGALVNQRVNPDLSQGLHFVAIANTATTITTWADAATIIGGWPSVTVGDAYALYEDRLSGGSPCVDAGDPAYVAASGELDLDGELRVWDGDGDDTARVDMGADEYGSFRLGDMACDGLVNNFDIRPFVLAITDPEAYAEAYPDCDYMLGDLTGDGLVNNFDISPFIRRITQP
ncbi:MAG: right-handed parallel beta-helix repeat-containing protein [Phycisphaerae bacterium]